MNCPFLPEDFWHIVGLVLLHLGVFTIVALSALCLRLFVLATIAVIRDAAERKKGGRP